MRGIPTPAADIKPYQRINVISADERVRSGTALGFQPLGMEVDMDDDGWTVFDTDPERFRFETLGPPPRGEYEGDPFEDLV
jgi:hypothetical protein